MKSFIFFLLILTQFVSLIVVEGQTDTEPSGVSAWEGSKMPFYLKYNTSSGTAWISFELDGDTLDLKVNRPIKISDFDDNKMVEIKDGAIKGDSLGIDTIYISGFRVYNEDSAEVVLDGITYKLYKSQGTGGSVTVEELQDVVGNMFSGNTETRIDATYDDAGGEIDLVVEDDLSLYDNTTSNFATVPYVNMIGGRANVGTILGLMTVGNTETLITVTYQSSDQTLDFVVDNNLANYDNQYTNFQGDDEVAAMIEDSIGTYDADNDGIIDTAEFVVNGSTSSGSSGTLQTSNALGGFNNSNWYSAGDNLYMPTAGYPSLGPEGYVFSSDANTGVVYLGTDSVGIMAGDSIRVIVAKSGLYVNDSLLADYIAAHGGDGGGGTTTTSLTADSVSLTDTAGYWADDNVEGFATEAGFSLTQKVEYDMQNDLNTNGNDIIIDEGDELKTGLTENKLIIDNGTALVTTSIDVGSASLSGLESVTSDTLLLNATNYAALDGSGDFLITAPNGLYASHAITTKGNTIYFGNSNYKIYKTGDDTLRYNMNGTIFNLLNLGGVGGESDPIYVSDSVNRVKYDMQSDLNTNGNDIIIDEGDELKTGLVSLLKSPGFDTYILGNNDSVVRLQFNLSTKQTSLWGKNSVYIFSDNNSIRLNPYWTTGGDYFEIDSNYIIKYNNGNPEDTVLYASDIESGGTTTTSLTADSVLVTDAGGYYDGDNQETINGEIGGSLADINDSITDLRTDLENISSLTASQIADSLSTVTIDSISVTQIYSEPYQITYAASITFNGNNGTNQEITLTGNVTSCTFSNLKPGGTYKFDVYQDSGGTNTFDETGLDHKAKESADFSITAYYKNKIVIDVQADGSTDYSISTYDYTP